MKAMWVGALVAAAACGPRGGASSASPAVTSVSIYSWGIDEYHGKVSSSVELGDDGCYRYESYHPMVGPSVLRSCMPADRAKALLAQVDELWAQGGWTLTSYSGPSETQEKVVYVTTADDKTWIAPIALPIEELSKLSSLIQTTVLEHYDRSSPSPDEVGPLEFAMVSFIVAYKGPPYRAEVDTLGRWHCSVPRGAGQAYSFDDETDVSAGTISADTAADLFADLFAGVSFEPAESRSVDATRVELRNYRGDSGRELTPSASRVVIDRWRKRATELSGACAVP